MQNKNSGFTLVELLGVIVILAILILVSSNSYISMVNKTREKASEEMRENLKEVALTYSLGNVHLSKCSVSFSEEVYIYNNINNLNKNSSCTKKITIGTLIDEGLFEDKRKYCNRDDYIFVYRYVDIEGNSEYKVYVSDTICKNR